MQSSFRSAVSLSSVQSLLSQLSGIAVFWVMMISLDKSSLGMFSWIQAFWLLIFSVSGFGLEHLVVQKVASGTQASPLMGQYLLHTLLVSVLILGCIVVGGWSGFLKTIVPFYLFAGLAISQILSFLTAPYRQIANGMEAYSSWFWMSATAHMVKLAVIPLLWCLHLISLPQVVMVYISAATAEWLLAILLFRFRIQIKPVFSRAYGQYKSLVRETLPQLGVIICQTALSRLDWVLLGWLVTPLAVAEYSVTNKLFELTTLPLLILAPVLFPRLIRMYHKGKIPSTSEKGFVQALLETEMLVAMGVVLVLLIVWVPVINTVTHQQYGASTFRILPWLLPAMPLLYLNHVGWSILFAREQMTTILRIFLLSFFTNAILNTILIRYGQGVAAAAVYSFSVLIQTAGYVYTVRERILTRALGKAILLGILVSVIYVLVSNLADYRLQLLTAMPAYLIIVTASGWYKWRIRLRALHYSPAAGIV
jgi:O-antigen/teichoic acid export membrane protein